MKEQEGSHQLLMRLLLSSLDDDSVRGLHCDGRRDGLGHCESKSHEHARHLQGRMHQTAN